jgi:hypothetical protein
MAAARKPDAAARIVVLRFASGMKIDLVTGMTEEDAIADCAGLALRNGATLPLFEAISTEIPAKRLIEFAGKAPPPPKPDERPAIPIGGAIHAFAAYVKATTPPIDGSKGANARDALRDFFGRYGCPVDFAGEPEPGSDEPAQP